MTTSEQYLQAGRIGTPPSVLESLAASSSEKIRAHVAENPAASVQILERLSVDENVEVRISVALNPSTPFRILWRLALDEQPDIRFAIAENPYCPLPILYWLSTDDSPYVNQRAERTLTAIRSQYRLVTQHTGGTIMAATTIERAMRRMLNSKERLTKSEAVKLRNLILADGYVSKSERKVVRRAMQGGHLDDSALEIFLDVLLGNARPTRNQPNA